MEVFVMMMVKEWVGDIMVEIMICILVFYGGERN